MIFRNLLCCVTCFVYLSPVTEMHEYCRNECVAGRYTVYDKTGDRVVVLDPSDAERLTLCEQDPIDLFRMIMEKTEWNNARLKVFADVFVTFIKSCTEGPIAGDLANFRKKPIEGRTEEEIMKEITVLWERFVTYIEKAYPDEVEKIRKNEGVGCQIHESIATIISVPGFEDWQYCVLSYIEDNKNAVVSQLKLRN